MMKRRNGAIGTVSKMGGPIPDLPFTICGLPPSFALELRLKSQAILAGADRSVDERGQERMRID
jgi:hypothetical protein